MSTRSMSAYKSFRYLQGVTTLRFYSDRCISCGRCIEVCPHAVFGRQNGRVVLLDRDACMECGACARNCPACAIEVRAGVGCAYAVLASTLFGKLRKGMGSSRSMSCCISEEPKSSPSCWVPAERVSRNSSCCAQEKKASQNSLSCVPVENSLLESPCCTPVPKSTKNTHCCGGGGCCGS